MYVHWAFLEGGVLLYNDRSLTWKGMFVQAEESLIITKV